MPAPPRPAGAGRRSRFDRIGFQPRRLALAGDEAHGLVANPKTIDLDGLPAGREHDLSVPPGLDFAVAGLEAGEAEEQADAEAADVGEEGPGHRLLREPLRAVFEGLVEAALDELAIAFVQ